MIVESTPHAPRIYPEDRRISEAMPEMGKEQIRTTGNDVLKWLYPTTRRDRGRI